MVDENFQRRGAVWTTESARPQCSEIGDPESTRIYPVDRSGSFGWELRQNRGVTDGLDGRCRTFPAARDKCPGWCRSRGELCLNLFHSAQGWI